MLFWPLFALMTGVAVFAVLWPLGRVRPRPAGSEADLAVYRDQLAEIERDRARGLLPESEAEAARVEVSRRLLAAGDSALLFALDEILERADFLSVGSNDLVQFLFAADRGNARVADRFDALSPPVLRALKSIVDAGRAHDKQIALCGELASRPLEAMALVALGFRKLSVSAAAIGPVKAMIMGLDVAKAEKALALALAEAQGRRTVRGKLESFAVEHDVPV